MLRKAIVVSMLFAFSFSGCGTSGNEEDCIDACENINAICGLSMECDSDEVKNCSHSDEKLECGINASSCDVLDSCDAY